jgi:hypothetical protein
MRRRWWVLCALAALVAASALGLFLAGPLLTCRWIMANAPLTTPDGVVRISGAALRPGPPAQLVARLDPAALHHLVTGLSRTWLPGFLFGDNQSCWGDLGGVPWRLEVASGAATALTGRLTPAEATRLLRLLLADERVSVTLSHATVVSLPGGNPSERRFRCTLAGTVLLHWAQGPFGADLDIPVNRCVALITVRPATGATAVSLDLEILDAVAPILGKGLTATAERMVNREITQALAEKPLPDWIPWDAELSLIAEPQATVDL